LNGTPNKRVAELEMPPVLDDLSPVSAVKAEAKPVEVTDVMLPDAESTPAQALENDPVLPAPDLEEAKDIEPLEAVKPNEKPLQREEKPSAPAPVHEDVQIAKVKTQPYKVNREVIKAEADFTNLEPAAAAEDRQEMRDRIHDLEAQLDVLKAENRALNDDLSVTLKESEDERMSISSENWNLERATMRYNEAERQIKRLGQQLQMERARCAAEQKDLEAMLFDPQVTNEQQLARLADLESQLMKAKSDLASERLIFEERIRVLESQLAQ
jgi:chromosome segregation ATPase